MSHRARRGRAARDRPRDPSRGAAAARGRCSSRCRWTTGRPRSTTAREPAPDRAHVSGRAAPIRPRCETSRGGSRAASARAGRRPRPRRRRALGAAVALAERQRLPVWATPRHGGGRIGFPEGHPHFQGILPPAIGPLGETLAGHDLVLVVGSSVFPYYPNIPGPLLPEGRGSVAITSDPDEAARAPMGDAIVADVALTLDALLAELGEADRDRRSRGRRPEPPTRTDPDPLSPTTVHAARRRVSRRRDRRARVALEHARPAQPAAPRRPAATTSAPAAGSASGSRRDRRPARPARPARWSASSARGRPSTRSRRLWTAAAYEVPVTFLVLRNEEYAILKWFATIESVSGAPGLDLPALDSAAAGRGLRRHLGQRHRARRAARGARRGDRRREPAPLSRCRWRRAWRWPEGLLPEVERIGRPPGRPGTIGPPTGRRPGRPSRCAGRSCVGLLGADRVLAGADLVRYASDASPYRLLPEGRRDGPTWPTSRSCSPTRGANRPR